MPPFYLWPLAFVALVPLAGTLVVRRTSRRDAAEAGILFGLAFYGLALHWVPFTLHGMIPLGALSGVLFLILSSGLGGVQGVVLRELLTLRSRLPVLVLPAVWVSTELLLARAGPWAFPWTPLGLALAPVPELAGLAEWVGPRGLTFWIAAVNGAIASVLVAWPGRRSVLAVGLSVCLLVVPAGWGSARAAQLPVHSLAPMWLVQMAVPREVLLDSDRRDAAAIDSLDRLLGETESLHYGEGMATLVVLPEAPFSTPWDEARESWLRDHANRLAVSILVGTHLSRPEAARSTTPDSSTPESTTSESSTSESSTSEMRSNALLLLFGNTDAELIHEKVRLVPGVERPGLMPGRGASMSVLDGVGIGWLICFEASFEADVRRLRREGADLIVNASNDGWFRPILGQGGSAAHAQQRAHLVMRAVESRMGAVRTSLGGEALVITPSGRVSVLGPAGGEGVHLARPTTTAVRTGFVRWGDLAGHLGALMLAVLWFGRSPRRSALTDP